jgi:hypothetical protein
MVYFGRVGANNILPQFIISPHEWLFAEGGVIHDEKDISDCNAKLLPIYISV